jgi:phthalate 4,5-dioxygenase oxygenase subunit
MLNHEDNDLITRVGPGTPMGNLLRRYWVPACLVSELPAPGGSPLRVRLLGEDLVAFRDRDGKVGLLAEACPHRGASLYFGRNETGADCGLRCVYHGWAFDTAGNCVDMPSEPRPFADRIKATSYPVQESGGIAWAYMGPAETMTPLPDYGHHGPKETEIPATKMLASANWVQVLEGNLDTAHISHLHQFFAAADIPDDGTDRPGYPSNMMSWKLWWHDRAPRLEVEDTWFGFRYAGLRTTPNGHTHVRMTSFVAPFTTIVAFVPFTVNPSVTVPIDDENTWRYSVATQPHFSNPAYIPGGSVFEVTPFRTSGIGYKPGVVAAGIIERDFNAANDYQIDRESQRTTTFSGVLDFNSQDNMVTESMGPIIRRWEEHLGTTDVAIIRMRTILINAVKALAARDTPPPALGGSGDFHEIRGAEKILEPGEDWRTLGTLDDYAVADAEGLVASD